MSMTSEEAIEALQKFVNGYEKNICGEAVRQNGFVQAIKVVISALRPITREQVEKVWKGEWIIEDAGDGDRRKKCSLCNQPISGWWGRDRFCANCGSPMTDEAVEILVKRMEEMRNG